MLMNGFNLCGAFAVHLLRVDLGNWGIPIEQLSGGMSLVEPNFK
jgi:hypothetical protein